MEEKTIVAHRGASFDLPGNTMEAYRRAIELGADMIELDVRRTKDGRLIAVFNKTNN
ncbi:MAG TPA: glycerophosphodiester phosphodiesterase [Terriglobales bacterium]|nr:glycerophosphodiester phosphodiesterase [Terriglobales bacterium]